MKKYSLGKTGIKVTEMCFGALPIGPLQANISVEEGAELIRAALERGINFIDTAEAYKTYPHIKKALESYHGEVIIATKSSAKTYKKNGAKYKICAWIPGADLYRYFPFTCSQSHSFGL